MQALAFFIYFSLFSYANNASVDSKIAQLAFHPEWLALHYYEENFPGGWKSSIRKNFFLSPEGFRSPKAELLAFYEAIQNTTSAVAVDTSNDDDPRCRFPARFRWLKKQFPKIQQSKKNVSCNRFITWQKQIQADGIYLLFASAFMNNPASMYGHTFLQFTRSGKTKGEPLLDYVVAFGADTGNAGGLAYVIGGLTGAFPGMFTTLPYYLKIKEYNDVESRDIWSYQLKINQEKINFLIEHLWELRDIHFPYYFLGKNCSYFLLRFLSVALDGKNLTADLPAWTIPIDTVRLLEREQLIGDKIFRPSRSKRVKQRRSLLQKNEMKIVHKIVKSHPQKEAKELKQFISDHLLLISEERQSPVLDAAYEYHRYLSASAAKEEQEKMDMLENTILDIRRNNPMPEEDLTWRDEISPELSHASNRIGLGVGVRKNISWEMFDWRPAIHDLLSNPSGLDPYSEQDIFHLRARFSNQTQMPVLESLRLLHIRALEPYDAWFPRAAWRFHLGWDSLHRSTCSDWTCGFFSMDGGVGGSFSILPNSENIFFILLGLNTAVGEPFRPRYRIGVGPELGIKIKLFSWWRMLMEAEWKSYVLGDKESITKYKGSQSFSISKTLAIRSEFIREQKENTFVGSGFYYF